MRSHQIPFVEAAARLKRAALRGLLERPRHAVFRVPELADARVGEPVEDGCAGLAPISRQNRLPDVEDDDRIVAVFREDALDGGCALQAIGARGRERDDDAHLLGSAVELGLQRVGAAWRSTRAGCPSGVDPAPASHARAMKTSRRMPAGARTRAFIGGSPQSSPRRAAETRARAGRSWLTAPERRG